MTKFQDESFTGEVIDLDGRWFVNCKFVNCHLRYSGDAECRFENSQVADGNVWEFKGAALNTVKLLSDVGVASLTPRPYRGPTRGITLDQNVAATMA